MLGQVSRWILATVLVLLVAASCANNGDSAAQLAVIAAPESEPTPLATTAPVDLPTATAVPTAVPTAVATPTAIPTAPASVAAPVVESTPEPVVTAAPVPTPLPAATATAVPAPTAAPEPTPAPEPTALPTAEPTAAPEPTVEAESADEPGTGGPPADHVVTDVGYTVLGQAGQVTLLLPVARIELIGFHEAGHPGAQPINAAGTGVEMMVLDSRGRGTPARSAADIVVPPGEPVRAPATGTVISASSYILYCEHQDSLVYIEPDGLPGWQVRVFHVTGPLPAVGDRVIAGETVIATAANLLPFESQVDEFTAEPSWAHVHVEVVDTSVPDTRPSGPGCP